MDQSSARGFTLDAVPCDIKFAHQSADHIYRFETALRLYCSGFHVFAGCLDSEIDGGTTLAKVDGSQRLVPLTLDVTKQEHVDKAFETVTSALETHNLGM